MDGAITVPKDNIEALKAKLAEAKANLRNARLGIVKSKINTAKAKVGNFLKTKVNNFRNSVGLLPLMLETRLLNVATKWEKNRAARIARRTERRKFVISKINTAKAKVGNFKRKIVNGFKKAVGKVKDFFSPDPEKREELIEQLKQQREELLALKEENERLREAGSYENLMGGKSRGSVTYLTVFVISLLVFAMFASLVIYKIIK